MKKITTSRIVGHLFIIICYLTTNNLNGQDLPINPLDCGYACSAQDVIIQEPYFAVDDQGTPFQPYLYSIGDTVTGYIAFSLVNTTGTDRYTPMIYTQVENGSEFSLMSTCYGTLPANQTKIYVSPQSFTHTFGDEFSLNNIWIGWNVSSKVCDDIYGATTCNKLIPSGKCGDYNNIPLYIKLPVETPPVFGTEICNNGIDDDNNGLTDCDDMGCPDESECTFTSTTGGNDSGLESNARLAEKINKRHFERIKNNTHRLNVKTEERNFAKEVDLHKKGLSIKKGTHTSRTKDRIDLFSLIPVDAIPNTTSFNSTPTDLNAITNAVETLSVDYFDGDIRKGAVLATISENGVYEHTKAVCDRVVGSKILDMWKIPIYRNKEFIITKLESEKGEIEYGCTFSFFIDEPNGITVENHWNVSDYHSNGEYYNFQVWANSSFNLMKVTWELLYNIENLNEEPLDFKMGQLPEVYIQDVVYKNNKLVLNFINGSGQKSVNIKGLVSDSETSTDRVFYDTFSLTGERFEQVVYDTNSVYSIGFTINEKEGTVTDNVFFADGVWGYDVDESKEDLQIFETYRDFQSQNDGDLYIERGAKIRGLLNEKFVLYRAIQAKFEALDISEFNGLAFNAKSNKIREMDVRLINPDLPYEEQMKARIVLNTETDQYYIDFSAFEGNLKNLDNITMMVFEVPNWENEPTHFILELTRLRLASSQSGKAMAQINGQERLNRAYPNPMISKATIAFESKISNTYQLYVHDMMGRTVHTSEGTLNQGLNRVSIERGNLPAGNYSYEVKLNKEENIGGILIMK